MRSKQLYVDWETSDPGEAVDIGLSALHCGISLRRSEVTPEFDAAVDAVIERHCLERYQNESPRFVLGPAGPKRLAFADLHNTAAHFWAAEQPLF